MLLRLTFTGRPWLRSEEKGSLLFMNALKDETTKRPGVEESKIQNQPDYFLTCDSRGLSMDQGSCSKEKPKEEFMNPLTLLNEKFKLLFCIRLGYPIVSIILVIHCFPGKHTIAENTPPPIIYL